MIAEVDSSGPYQPRRRGRSGHRPRERWQRQDWSKGPHPSPYRSTGRGSRVAPRPGTPGRGVGVRGVALSTSQTEKTLTPALSRSTGRGSRLFMKTAQRSDAAEGWAVETDERRSMVSQIAYR